MQLFCMADMWFHTNLHSLVEFSNFILVHFFLWQVLPSILVLCLAYGMSHIYGTWFTIFINYLSFDEVSFITSSKSFVMCILSNFLGGCIINFKWYFRHAGARWAILQTLFCAFYSVIVCQFMIHQVIEPVLLLHILF